jgi:hypothetical protein
VFVLIEGEVNGKKVEEDEEEEKPNSFYGLQDKC